MAPVIENNYVGDGTTVLYSFTFPYIDVTDVDVSLDEVVTTEYTLANPTTVEFNTAPADGVKIRIYRNTEVDTVKATFYPGSAIRSQDLNDNFEQILFVTQEADSISERADGAAKEALEAADEARQAAQEATEAADRAEEIAGDSADLVAEANQAAQQAAADAAQAEALATTANANASAAFDKANDAEVAATQAEASATSAQDSASAAEASAAAAEASAASASGTANDANTKATQALSTANAADAKADTALATANTAQSTANTAADDAEQAKRDASAALEAVGDSLDYTLVPNVAAIPGSPSDAEAIQVVDSTGIESFSPLADLPADFVGDPGLYVRIVYRTSNNSWNFITFAPNDPDTRYARLDSNNTFSASNDFLSNVSITGSADAKFFRANEPNPAGSSSACFLGQLDGAETSRIKADGSAEFNNRVDLNGGVTVNGGASMSTGFYYRNDSGTEGVALYKDGANSANRNVHIKTDGSAEFTGSQSLKIRPTLTDSSSGYALALFNQAGNDTKFSVGANGSVDALYYRAERTGSTDTILEGKLNGTRTTFIQGDGGATFAQGDLEIANEGALGAKLNIKRSSGSTAITVFDTNDASQIELKADGSAEFASTVKSDGQIRCDRFKCGSGASQDSILLNNDGSAEFGGVNLSSASTSGQYLDSAGWMALQRPNGNTGNALEIYAGTSLNSVLKADGSAEFAGGDITFSSSGTAVFNGKVSSAATADSDSVNTLTTKSYVDAKTINPVKAFGKVDGAGNLYNSFNVASVTRDGNNNYRVRVTFQNDMPDVNYVIIASLNAGEDYYNFIDAKANSVSQMTISTRESDGTPKAKNVSFVVYAV